MPRLPRTLVSALVVLAAGCTAGAPAPPGPSAAGSSSASPPGLLLALGDSVASGLGAPAPARDGWVAVLGRRLGLEVRNLSTPGATTSAVARRQLPRARSLLAQRDVRLVTVTAGGNDVFGPVLRACATDAAAPPCAATVQDALDAADEGLDEVLGGLADAVPDQAPVAVMAYYDPLPACRLAGLAPLSAQVLEGAGGAPGLNDLVRARAAEHGALVVETADRVREAADLVGGDDCLHPSGRGHTRIAHAFLDAVGPRLPG